MRRMFLAVGMAMMFGLLSSGANEAKAQWGFGGLGPVAPVTARSTSARQAVIGIPCLTAKELQQGKLNCLELGSTESAYGALDGGSVTGRPLGAPRNWPVSN